MTEEGKGAEDHEVREDFWDRLIRALCDVQYGCCFCCLSLHAGAVIVGWTFVLGLALNTLGFWFLFAIIHDWLLAHPFGKYLPMICARADALVYAAHNIILGLISVFLLIGIHKDYLKLMKIWVLVSLTLLITGVVYVVVKPILLLVMDNVNRINIALSALLSTFCLVTFFSEIIVVKSYYVKRLNSKHNNGPHYNYPLNEF